MCFVTLYRCVPDYSQGFTWDWEQFDQSENDTSEAGDKTLLKEKRKHREELFIEQKKRKLLPDAILQQLTIAPEADLKKSPGNVKVNSKKRGEHTAKGRNSKKVKIQKVQSNRLKATWL
ncbi:hypothetical protein U0070_002133 [Myodes glareolus]|uniref:Uncharacterized protein n=1 Tax=Myodes glareolus TaxID=447135 RepID=A0AAW0JP90_MYOGA